MLTDKELGVLKHLRENSRATVTEIGRKVNLPRSTVYDKIRKLRESGVIKKYSCLVNFEQLGLPIAVKVLFRVDGKDRARFGEMLTNCPNSNDVVKLGNDFDYLVSFAFSSMNELHEFLDGLSKCCNTNYSIMYVSKELKKEGFLV